MESNIVHVVLVGFGFVVASTCNLLVGFMYFAIVAMESHIVHVIYFSWFWVYTCL